MADEVGETVSPLRERVTERQAALGMGSCGRRSPKLFGERVGVGVVGCRGRLSLSLALAHSLALPIRSIHT